MFRVNRFMQQIMFCKNRFTIHDLIETFGNERDLIEYDTVENLLNFDFIQPRLMTATHCNVEDLYEVQGHLKQDFSNGFY